MASYSFTSSNRPGLAVGEDTDFEVVYRRHGRRVRLMLSLALSDHHAVEDAAQEVFARASLRFHEYDPNRGEVHVWLLGFARKVILEERRRGRHMVVMDPDELVRHCDAGHHAPDPLTPGTAIAWVRDELVPLVRHLPHGQAEAFMLTRIIGLDPEEASELTGKSAETIRKLAYRGQGRIIARVDATDSRPYQRVPI